MKILPKKYNIHSLQIIYLKMQRRKMLGKISGLSHFCDGTVSFSQKKLLSAIFKLFLCKKYLFKSPDFLKPVNMSIILDISKKSSIYTTIGNPIWPPQYGRPSQFY